MGDSAWFARRTGRIALAVCLGLFAWAGPVPRTFADGATRDLPDHYGPDTTLTVTIAIDPPDPPDPPGSPVPAGFEDSPPVGWTVSNISDGGTWDAQMGKVKWLFLSLPIPEVVTYDVTPPASGRGEQCFTGIAIFPNTEDLPITGDQCIAIVVPTLSEWGLAVMALLVITAGTIVIEKRGKAIFYRSSPVVPPAAHEK
jgi:hypothetical protein